MTSSKARRDPAPAVAFGPRAAYAKRAARCRPPFPGLNNPAAVLAVKAEPFGCADAQPVTAPGRREKETWISGKGGFWTGAFQTITAFFRCRR